MKPTLQKFEGEIVSAAGLRLAGRMDDRVGSLRKGEEFYVIVRGVVTHITHGDEAGIMTRQHKAKASAMVLLDGDAGARMLDEASMLADDRFGIRNLFNQDPPEAP